MNLRALPLTRLCKKILPAVLFSTAAVGLQLFLQEQFPSLRAMAHLSRPGTTATLTETFPSGLLSSLGQWLWPSPWSVNALIFLLLIPTVWFTLRGFGVLQDRRRLQFTATALIVIGASLRFAFQSVLHRPEDHIFSDMETYVRAAVELLNGDRSLHHLFHPLGYPLLLTASLAISGSLALALGVQYLLGVAAFVLMWRGSVRFVGEKAALFVLALGAFHFPFISMSGFFMAETGFTFLLALLFQLMARKPFPWKPKWALLLGGVYMSAGWLKGNNSLLGPLVLAWIGAWSLSWKKRTRSDWRQWASVAGRPAAAFTIGALLVAATTASSNHSLFGIPRIAAATGALNFVEGKCPDKINYDSSGAGWWSPLFVQLNEKGEKRWPAFFWEDQFFWKAGWDCVRDDPWVLATSVRYIYYLFFGNESWPSNVTSFADWNRGYQVFFSFLIFPGFVLGMIRLARRPLKGRHSAFLMILSLCLASWLLKSEMRYRIPFDVAILPAAVLGWTSLWSRLKPRKTSD